MKTFVLIKESTGFEKAYISVPIGHMRKMCAKPYLLLYFPTHYMVKTFRIDSLSTAQIISQLYL